jgi:hypothetical protein
MKIISLELYGYKRVRVNMINHIKITFNEIVQLILGTNGSGKSSLVAELSPQPADKEFYEKDGYKIIVIQYKGNTYTLSSHFSPKAVHSIMVDGVELNRQGTPTVQKDLVKQIFGHTAEIHELMLGNDKFHDMGPALRQKWITMLCPTDYSYAISTYIKLKERLRDATGALRRNRERLVAETSKTIAPDEIARLEKEVNQIHRELNELQSHRSPLTNPVSYYQGRQEVMVKELEGMSLRLLNTRLSAPNSDMRNPMRERDEWGQLHEPVFNCVEDVDYAIDQLRHNITAKETLLNTSVREHTRLSEVLKTLIKTGQAGLAELYDRVVEARGRRQEVLDKRKLGLLGVNGSKASAALESVYEYITNFLSTIPENIDRRYSSENYNAIREDIFNLKDARTKMIVQLERMNAKRTHMEVHRDSGSVECPKCTHKWTAGYNIGDYQQLLGEIAKQEETISATDKKIIAAEEEAQINLNYGNEYRGFIRCTQGSPDLTPLWDYLIGERIISNEPRRGLGVLSQFRSDLELEIAAGAIDEEIAKTNELIRLVEQTGDMDLSETNEALDKCTVVIEHLTSDVRLLQTAVADHVRYRKQLQDMNELNSRIINQMKDIRQVNTDMVEMMRRETLQLCIRQYQSALAQKEEVLNYVQLQKALVDDLKEQIAQTTLEEEACKHLVAHLSPSEGLIAKGLLGFIKTFVGQMNGLIRKIWTYPLQIMDCGTTGEHGTELDYKFPLVVKTASNVVKDVSKGSTSMKEIVDLAFRVVAMAYLGMEDYPLMLDEFGKTFDEAHRSSAADVVKRLMDEKPFSQLFMISHYADTYGSLTQAEICVLCPANITIPKTLKYNQHVSIN